MMTLRFAYRFLLGLAACGALCFSAVAAPPDTPENALPAKKIVKEVQVVSEGGAPVDPNRIKAHMQTHPGSAFSDEIVGRDIKSLYATGLVSTVDITTQDAAGGVVVVVKVTGRGSVGEVSF